MKKIDIHTHVLPGIDDGARDWDTCLEMLALSAKNGVDAVIATPHYLPWRRKATAEQIRQMCVEAKEKLFEKQGITIDIYPGNEIYYNVDTIRDLKEGKILALADSRYVLVEFSTKATYQTICHAIRNLQNEGYIPIIAHVERCECLLDEERFREIKQMGVLFQVNEETVRGGFFRADSRWVRKRLLEQQIDFLASDMHGMRTRLPLSEQQLYWINKKLNVAYRKELLYSNAKKILADERV